MEIPEDEERERLRLRRKLQEARVTEIWFAPDFDTGKMLAGLCGPVPDDLLRKECSRAGRELWRESPAVLRRVGVQRMRSSSTPACLRCCRPPEAEILRRNRRRRTRQG